MTVTRAFPAPEHLPEARRDGPSRRSRGGPRPLTRLLLVVTLAVLFAVSGGLLWVIGINYEGLSGSGASKIHPSTYLMILLFGWMAFTSGDIVGYVVDLGGRRPASAFLLLATMVTFVQTVLRHG